MKEISNLKFSGISRTLNRSEIKSVMGGLHHQEGNKYCRGPVEQYPCNKPTLEQCLDQCVELHGNLCGGCGQFPPLS